MATEFLTNKPAPRFFAMTLNQRNSSKLLKTILPYQCILTIFALAPPPPPPLCSWQRRKLLVGGYCVYALATYMVTIYVTYLNNSIVDLVIDSYDLDTITNALSIGLNIVAACVLSVMLLTELLGYWKLQEIYEEIDNLERDIKAVAASHKSSSPTDNGVEDFFEKHQKFHYLLLSRSGLLSIFLIFVAPSVHIPLMSRELTFAEKMPAAFVSLQIQMKSVEFCVLAQLIRELLRRLERHLMQVGHEVALNGKHKNINGDESKSHSYGDLQKNQQLLGRLWFLVTDLETYFGASILALFLHNGISITHTVNWAYTNFLVSGTACNLMRFYYTIVLLLNMLVPAWLSQVCIDAYSQFGVILHSLKSERNDLLLSAHLREYSLQLLHHKLKFSCFGFFDINLRYFGLTVLTITTYVVILIQFKLQGEIDTGERKQILVLKENIL